MDRQLNASLNIFLKMCGFPHLFLTPSGSRWVGVTPLRGGEVTGFPATPVKPKG